MVEASWKTVTDYFPEARVFTPVSISSKNAPVSQRKHTDLPEEDERVFGVLNISTVQETSVALFRMSDFNEDITLYTSIISEKSTHIIGSSTIGFAVAYQDDHSHTFNAVHGQFPIVMADSSGSLWNVFGIAVSGPRKGERLNNAMAFFGSWWAWKDFYSDFTFVK